MSKNRSRLRFLCPFPIKNMLISCVISEVNSDQKYFDGIIDVLERKILRNLKNTRDGFSGKMDFAGEDFRILSPLRLPLPPPRPG
jgi:hypothetical protein